MNSPPEPATVGVLLRERRQQLGYSLQEIAQRTCVRRTYLEALEADRFDLLPGEVYARGFVRIYAEVLDLEAAQLLAQLGRHEESDASPTEASAGRVQGANAGALHWVVLLLVVFFGLVGAFLYHEWQAAKIARDAVITNSPLATERAMPAAESLSTPSPDATVEGDAAPPEQLRVHPVDGQEGESPEKIGQQ